MAKKRKSDKIKIKIRFIKPRVPQQMMRNRRFEDKRRKKEEKYFKKQLRDEGY